MTERGGSSEKIEHGEFAQRLVTPVGEEERAEMIELIRWFSRRYPTPKARLDYARRKHAEWTRHRGTRDRTEP